MARIKSTSGFELTAHQCNVLFSLAVVSFAVAPAAADRPPRLPDNAGARLGAGLREVTQRRSALLLA